jgi:hypothetical protein
MNIPMWEDSLWSRRDEIPICIERFINFRREVVLSVTFWSKRTFLVSVL